MFARMGPWEIALIVVIILIVFGVGKLPQVGGAIGKGLRSFRKGQQGVLDDDEEEEEAKVAASSATKTKTKRKSKAKS
ncbi:MAG: twin-arginine translocase TatA/TatE family subunit [Dehalococcoidales bacterium]